MVQNTDAAREIERERLEREVLTVTDHDLDVRRCVGARACGELLVRLDRDDFAHMRRHRERERAGPSADVEHAFVAVEHKQLVEERSELRRTRLPTLRAPIGVRHSTTSRRVRSGEVSSPQASS